MKRINRTKLNLKVERFKVARKLVITGNTVKSVRLRLKAVRRLPNSDLHSIEKEIESVRIVASNFLKLLKINDTSPRNIQAE